MAYLQMASKSRDSWGWLYLFGLKDGRVKVGRTVRVRERLAHHRRQHGPSFDWVHIYPQKESGSSECAAIHALRLAGQRVGRTEMFTGISKQQAIQLCRAAVHTYGGLRRRVVSLVLRDSMPAPQEPAEQGA